MPDPNTNQLYAQLLHTIGATDQIGAMRELARLHALDLAAQDRQASQADYPNPGAPARLRPAVQDDARAPRVLNAPARIWLNVGEILRDYEFSDLQGIGDVSWCDDQIDKHDVEYVRADLAASAAQGEASIPFAYAYRFTDPLSGAPVWRLSSATWNGQLPLESRALYLAPQPSAPGVVSDAPFQQRVQPWMLECFGAEISADRVERNHRFFEEALELVQANGMPRADALALVDYVYGRPPGVLSQEVGGVMVTLAALCLASGTDMHADGETELSRINAPDMIEKIRAKQASKPRRSALPVAAAQPSADDAPIPMLLFCPQCSMQHIDAPETPRFSNDDTGASEEYRETMFPAWTNPPHRSHLCHGCGHIWRPADVATTGVAALKTSGKRDGSPIPSPPADARDAGNYNEGGVTVPVKELRELLDGNLAAAEEALPYAGGSIDFIESRGGDESDDPADRIAYHLFYALHAAEKLRALLPEVPADRAMGGEP